MYVAFFIPDYLLAGKKKNDNEIFFTKYFKSEFFGI